MKRALVALVPLLAGNDFGDCPPQPTTHVFDAVVEAVEVARYECAMRPSKIPGACIEAQATASGCDVALAVVLADGTRRTAMRSTVTALAICELPPGNHTATICTHDGPKTCAVAVSDRSVLVFPSAAQPHRYRYRVRADAAVPGLGGPALVLESDEVALVAGDRRRFAIAGNVAEPLLVDRCEVLPIPAPKPPARGCGHCSTGSPGAAAAIAAMLALILRRRR